MGTTVFDRCMVGAGFSDATNNGGACASNGATTGTPGSSYGWSASTGLGGTSGITAAAVYLNILHLGGQSPVGDAWGTLQLNFAGSTFYGKNSFTFQADSDTLTSAAPDVPEPTSMLLVGSGLLLAGFLGKRRAARKS